MMILKYNCYKLLVGLFGVLLLCSCDITLEKEKSNKKGIKDGVVKQYWAGKVLKNAISYKNGKRDGLAQTYYKDGKLRQQITYKQDKKHGKAITYYQNGKIYQETPYKNGEIEGVRKKYRQNGKLMAEIPYFNGQPCSGLKEYLLNGNLKKQYPSIQIQEVDNILKNGQFDLLVKMSDGTRNVDFYINVPLSEEGCIAKGAMSRSNHKPGVMKISYNLPTNAFIMEELSIVAVAKTKLGNPYVTFTKHNLAIENRGF